MRSTYDYEHIVTFDETNLVGNVYFTNHLRWQGHCRELFLQEHAPNLCVQLGESLVLVTTRCSCEYYAELAAFDRVLVRMSLGAVRQNRLLLSFEYLRSTDAGVELVARGEQEVACLERDGSGLHPTPVPAELGDALRPYQVDSLRQRLA